MNALLYRNDDPIRNPTLKPDTDVAMETEDVRIVEIKGGVNT